MSAAKWPVQNLLVQSSSYNTIVYLLLQSEGHRQILTRELEAVGLRLNKRPPQVCQLALLIIVFFKELAEGQQV